MIKRKREEDISAESLLPAPSLRVVVRTYLPQELLVRCSFGSPDPTLVVIVIVQIVLDLDLV